MSTAATAQLAFAAEFALFLVAAAGAASAVRPGLLATTAWARSSLASGFLGLAVVSFLRGALVVDSADRGFVPGLRLVSVVLVLVGLVRWRGRRGAVAVGVALALIAVAAIAQGPEPSTWADGLRIVAAVVVAGALVSAARRSISARIAVDAAGLVLGVVLVVALAVSVTVADNVDGQAEQRYAARADTEAEAVVARARSGLGPARVIAGVLATERADALARSTQGATASDQAVLAGALSRLTAPALLDLRTDPVVLVGASGSPLAASPGALSPSTGLALAGDAVVTEARRGKAERQGVTVVGDTAFALAAVPVVVRSSGRAPRNVGTAVVARRLDRTYLRVLGTGGERLSFALATRRQVIARAGPDRSGTDVRDVAGEVVERGLRPHRRSGERFVAGAPIGGGDGRTVLAFVVSAPADAAEATRDALFRTLFLVALGAALVAVALAVVVGERIGRGLRRLTVAAEGLQAGALDTSLDVGRNGDELGVLGRAFTTMARSIQVRNRALRRAAVQEAAVRARLQAVVAGMGEALVAVDGAGSVIELNGSAEDLLGRTRAEALGTPVEEIVAWRRDGRAVALARSDLVDGESLAAELAVGDHTVPVLVTTGVLVGRRDGVEGTVMVMRDMRREQEVDNLKSAILANIGHELRTPLTPIKGYAAMFRDHRLDHDQTEAFAEEIIGGVDQLERVIGQLVTFATIAAGRLSVQAATVPIGDMSDAVRQRWSGRVDASHRFSVSATDPGLTVELDPVLVAQAIDELVDNALKYSPDGGAVTVAFDVAGEASELVVTVNDAGVGMPPGQLDAVANAVDPFRQGDASETRRFGGLGLGLACADRIVRAHGGRLVTQFEHAGTSISILLPMSQGTNGATT